MHFLLQYIPIEMSSINGSVTLILRASAYYEFLNIFFLNAFLAKLPFLNNIIDMVAGLQRVVERRIPTRTQSCSKVRGFDEKRINWRAGVIFIPDIQQYFS